MSLSEERKRQIREEETAAFHAEQEAEARYREQIRQELLAQQQQETESAYREQVRTELHEAPTPAMPHPVSPPAESAPPSSPPVLASHTSTPSPRPRSHAVLWLAGLLVFTGVACMGMAFMSGFTVPVIGAPREIEFTSDPAGAPEPMDEDAVVLPATAAAPRRAKSSPSSTAGTRKPGAITSTGRGSRPAPIPPVPNTLPISAGARRAILPGTDISIEVPSDWVVEESEYDDILDITWRGSGMTPGREGEVAYLLLQRLPLQRGETTEQFAERLLEEFDKSTTLEQEIRYENDDEIADFHGVPAVAVDVIARGEYPYRMRNIYWTAGGAGYLLTCYATAGNYAERLPAFTRMLNSLRLKREGR